MCFHYTEINIICCLYKHEQYSSFLKKMQCVVVWILHNHLKRSLIALKILYNFRVRERENFPLFKFRWSNNANFDLWSTVEQIIKIAEMIEIGLIEWLKIFCLIQKLLEFKKEAYRCFSERHFYLVHWSSN